MPATTNGVYLTATATAQTVNYTVEYYQQNIGDDLFTIVGTAQPKTGTTDTDVNLNSLSSQTYEGFTYSYYTVQSSVIKDATRGGSLNIEGDQTLVVRLYYTRNVYTITLTANKGVKSVSLAATSMTQANGVYSVRFGATVTLAAEEMPGYTFAGWTVDKSSTTVVLTGANRQDATFTVPSGNVMLTANATANTNTKYQANYYVQNADRTFVLDTTFTEYTINAHTAGQTGTTDTLASIDVLSAVEYKGMKYSYYVATSTTNGAEGVTNGNLNIDGDGSLVINLYYVRETYKLTLNTSVGVATATASEDTGIAKGAEANTYDVMYNVTVQLAHTLNTTGYTFKEWTVNAGNVTVSASETFVMPTEQVVLTATANANVYKITYHGNSGKTEDGKISIEQSVTYASIVTLIANTFVKEGYTFGGWALSETSLDVAYADGATFKYETIGNIDLYAIWGENTYTISFNGNGGNGTMTSINAIFDQEITLPENEFTRTG